MKQNFLDVEENNKKETFNGLVIESMVSSVSPRVKSANANDKQRHEMIQNRKSDIFENSEVLSISELEKELQVHQNGL